MNKKIDITYLIIMILLISACFMSWNIYFKVYTQKDTVDIHHFPKTIGQWTSEEIPLTETEYAILETKNAFVRHYSLPSGEEVNIFIVYSQHNRKVSHPPEICYTGGGTSVISKKISKLSLDFNPKGKQKELKFDDLIMDSINMQQVVIYWFKVGNSFTPSYWKQQFLIALKTLTGQPSSSALIRISTVIKDNDVDSAQQTVKKFAKQIIPLIYKYLP